jgi:hypothetical protein
MTVADRIESLVRRCGGLTEAQIADELFTNAYQQRVNSTCRRLVRESRLRREGKGGRGDPYTYYVL